MADLVIADREVVADVFLQIIREHIARNKEQCEPLRYFNADFDITKYIDCLDDVKLLKRIMDVWLLYAHGFMEPTEDERRLIPHFPADKVQEIMHAKRKYDVNIDDFQTRHQYHGSVIDNWTRYKK